MSENNKANEYIWLAYCDFVKGQALPTLGEGQAIFYGSLNQRGPLGSAIKDIVPEEVTNDGIYSMGDHLLNPRDLFYVPNPLSSYIDHLALFMQYIDLGGNHDSGALQRLATATKVADEDRTFFLLKQAEALQEWKDAKSAGITTQDFASWAVLNANNYNTAKSQWNSSSGDMEQRMKDVYGESADQWTQDNNRIKAAIYGEVPLSGLNMPCVAIDNSTAAEYLSNIKTKTPSAPVTGVYYRPLYSVAGYGAAIDNWVNIYNDKRPEGNTRVINLQGGSQVNIDEFGIDKVDGIYGFSWFNFLSFGFRGESETQRRTIDTSSSSYSVSIEFYWNDIRPFNITAGVWDIGDKYAKASLRDDAPDDLIKQGLVRPTQLLCGSKVGMKIKFDTNTAKAVDTLYKQYNTTGGDIRILGYPIEVGGTVESTREDTTHVSSWDSANGELNVLPSDDSGTCQLLGIVGVKLLG